MKLKLNIIVLALCTHCFETFGQNGFVEVTSDNPYIIERESVNVFFSPAPIPGNLTWQIELEFDDIDAGFVFVERKVAFGRGGDTDFNLPVPGDYRVRYINRTFSGEFENVIAESKIFSALQVVPLPESITNYPSGQGKFVLVGDSLVKGVGASEGNSLPEQLGRLIGREIISAGISGETTGELLKRISEVLSLEPDMVIVLSGFNDFRTGVPDDITFRNLGMIVDKVQSSGVVCVVVGIREPVLDDFERQFRTLTDDTGSGYVPNILFGIRDNPRYWNILETHPNDEGYSLMASRVAPAVRALSKLPPKLLFKSDGDGITLLWSSIFGRNYRVMQAETIPSEWIEDTTLIGIGGTMSAGTDFKGQGRFFRLEEYPLNL
ncbi:MAG: hypothetical protein COV70_04295 [Parcubacteria group bacterium CG11_big_fil_rev_8_21_14_0_20_39_22]|nr:MAG: hypothetical protein COV70_04295 [Parcubacteria group bacterium CG11_big_fil_rev_8_21_14_0_20_39_22]